MENNENDSLFCKLVIKFIAYVVLPALPGILYSRIWKYLGVSGLMLINGLKSDDSIVGFVFGNLIGLFAYHILFVKIIYCIKRNFINDNWKFVICIKEKFKNITFKDYLYKMVLIGYIWCYTSIVVNKYTNDVALLGNVIVMYITIFTLFNSKLEKNY